jgi:hypothetical protein
MARVTAAMLCDFAQVREGLLFVQSAGVNRMWRAQTPANLGCMLGVVFEVGPGEYDQTHTLRVTVKQVDTALAVVRIDGTARINSTAGYEPGEAAVVPLALDLRLVEVPSFGQYDVQIAVDGGDTTILSCWVKPIKSAA